MIQKSKCTDSLVRRAVHLVAVSILATVLIGTTNSAFTQQGAANPARITEAVDNAVLTTLKGNVHPLAKPHYDRGPVNPSLPAERMQLVLRRSSGQEIALRQFLGSLQDPNSPQYRKWLTPEQFGEQFGVSDADIQTVKQSVSHRRGSQASTRSIKPRRSLNFLAQLVSCTVQLFGPKSIIFW